MERELRVLATRRGSCGPDTRQRPDAAMFGADLSRECIRNRFRSFSSQRGRLKERRGPARVWGTLRGGPVSENDETPPRAGGWPPEAGYVELTL